MTSSLKALLNTVSAILEMFLIEYPIIQDWCTGPEQKDRLKTKQMPAWSGAPSAPTPVVTDGPAHSVLHQKHFVKNSL